MKRFRVLPAERKARESWLRRSSFVLGRYLDEHDATLAAFGLERPIEPGRVRAYLSDHSRRRRAEGHTMHTEGGVSVPLPDGHVSRMAALPELAALVSTARRIAANLDCDPGLVVSFLLTGKASPLPWIDIETLQSDLGPAFVIHVGSADIEGGDVRKAYVTAVRTALGTESTRALPAHVYPLVENEVKGRLAGLTWRQRWEEWKRYAAEWSITKYETVESYRNYIKKKAGQHGWIHHELEAADAERLFRATEEDE